MDFDLKGFLQRARPEKIDTVNRLGGECAIAMLEAGERRDLRPDELAYALLGTVSIVLRNLGGNAMLPRNMRTFAQKLHDYAGMLEKGVSQPTDNILPI